MRYEESSHDPMTAFSFFEFIFSIKKLMLEIELEYRSSEN